MKSCILGVRSRGKTAALPEFLSGITPNKGFSLVEMLMALLVASLLMVALAPVITKKFSENLSISSIGGTRADYKRTWYYDPAKEYHEWSVPNGVNVIKVTAIGGGGAGGGASFGSRIFTSTQDWTVPTGVEKIRVFMIGGGGGGAAGGPANGVYKTGFSQTTETYNDYTVGKNNVTLSDGAKIPTMYQKCADSGVTNWTLVEEANNPSITSYTPYVPGRYMIKVTACGGGGGGVYPVKGAAVSWAVWPQGGGGGGSGGYLSNIKFKDLTSPKLHVWVGGGGNSGLLGAGGGGQYTNSSVADGQSGGTYGGKGGKAGRQISGEDGGAGKGEAKSVGGRRAYFSSTWYAGHGGAGGIWGGGGGGGAGGSDGGGHGYGGAGGGGPTTILTSDTVGSDSLPLISNILLQVGGGGGGGGVKLATPTACAQGSMYSCGGGGGGGGGYSGGGGGGGGGGYYNCSGATSAVGDKGTGGSKYSDIIGGGTGTDGTAGYIYGDGGGGGGGFGGNAGCRGDIKNAGCGNVYGGGGVVNTVFGSDYCNGGTQGGNAGKNGKARIYYGGSNLFQCKYHQKAHGGGGGGAGQIWIGEISVKNVNKINISIGSGGSAPNTYGGAGGDGGKTIITVGGSSYSVSGGKGGTHEEDATYISNTGGTGGGIKSENFNNWTSVTLFDTPSTIPNISDGQNGSTSNDGAGGGQGGSVYLQDGTTMNGGTGGGVQASGSDASTSSNPTYGTGGGGGGGVVDSSYTANSGLGGKGAPGYVYIEWGGTNGGGGASGQIITQESIWVTPGTIVKIYPGKGGTAKELTSLTDGSINQGKKGEDGEDGGDTYLIIKDGTADKKAGIAKGGKGGIAGLSDHGRGGGIKVGAGGNYDPNNIQPEIENSTPGESATDEHGGMGGTLTEEMCPLLTELKKVGLGGCGGNTSTAGACQNAVLVTGEGVNAGGIGNGGGGGAVTNTAGVKTPYKGGNGSGGMVTIEWSN